MTLVEEMYFLHAAQLTTIWACMYYTLKFKCEKGIHWKPKENF